MSWADYLDSDDAPMELTPARIQYNITSIAFNFTVNTSSKLFKVLTKDRNILFMHDFVSKYIADGYIEILSSEVIRVVYAESDYNIVNWYSNPIKSLQKLFEGTDLIKNISDVTVTVEFIDQDFPIPEIIGVVDVSEDSYEVVRNKEYFQKYAEDEEVKNGIQDWQRFLKHILEPFQQ